MIHTFTFFDHKRIDFVIDVENQEIADDMMQFCYQLAMLANNLDTPQSKIYQTLDERAKNKGYSKDAHKALYRLFSKWIMIIQHPEWF